MWTYQGKAMKPGRGWTDAEGTKYPAQWYGRTTDAEKIAVGWVEVADPAPFDNRFYWSAGNPRDVADLKTNAVAQTKVTAGSLLAPTDWYIVREQETGEVTPTDILNYRQAVRTASEAIEIAILACTTHSEFMALYDAHVDAEGNVTGNAPINNWPEEL